MPIVINPKDPLQKAGPEQQRELFNQFCALASGFPSDAVVGAAWNVLINGLRQSHATRQAVEASYDDWSGRMKTLLLSHYDGAGKRRNIFPHHQVIEMPFFDDRDGFKRR